MQPNIIAPFRMGSGLRKRDVKTSLYSMALLVVIVLALGGNSAFAFDAKVYAGSGCSTNQQALVNDLLYYLPHIYNDGVDYIPVVCPVIRDKVNNVVGTQVAEVSVQSNGVNTLWCQLFAYDTVGGFVASAYDDTTNSVPTTLNVDIALSVPDGPYVLICGLPPGGTLYSYKISE